MKVKKLDQSGVAHWLVVGLFVLLIGVVGYRVATINHASTLADTVSPNLSKVKLMVFTANHELYTSSATGTGKVVDPTGVGKIGVLDNPGSLSAVNGVKGQLIFYASKVVNNTNALYSVNPNGSSNSLVNSVTVPSNYYISELAWSESAQKLAVVEANSTGDTGQPASIYTFNHLGGAVTKIFTGEYYMGEPVWSPDGTKLAVSTTVSGSPVVEVMNADGTNPVTEAGCSSQVLQDYGLSWSTDSQNIYCISKTGVTEVNLASGTPTTIVDPSSLASNTAITSGALSPDGTQLVYTTDSTTLTTGNQSCSVFDLTLATSTTTTVTTSAARQCLGVDWIPDSSLIAVSEGAKYSTANKIVSGYEVFDISPTGANNHKIYSGSNKARDAYSLSWSTQ